MDTEQIEGQPNKNIIQVLRESVIEKDIIINKLLGEIANKNIDIERLSKALLYKEEEIKRLVSSTLEQQPITSKSIIIGKTEQPYDAKQSNQPISLDVYGQTNLHGKVIVDDDIIIDGRSLKVILREIIGSYSLSRSWGGKSDGLGDYRAINTILGRFTDNGMRINANNDFWKTSDGDLAAGNFPANYSW